MVKIFSLVLLLVGLTAGLVLVDQRQDIREKAATCSSITLGLCGTDGGCAQGKMCTFINDINYGCVTNNYCGTTSSASCSSLGGSCTDGSCLTGYTDLGRANCAVDSKCCKPTTAIACKVCENNKCVSTGFGGCAAGLNECSTNAGCSTGNSCKKSLVGKCGSDGGCSTGDMCTYYMEEYICKNDSSCDSSTPPGGGGGDTSGSCSSESAAKCLEKSPGDTCKSGKKCKKTSKKGSDGKNICKCSGTSSDDDEEDSSSTTNPSKIGPFTSAGEVVIFFQPTTYKVKIALKKNSDTCSLSSYDKLLESSNFSSSAKITTGVTVASGDYLCVYVENIGTDTTKVYPALGWTAPESNKCGQGEYEKVDISSLVAKVTTAGLTAFSTQCWGDYGVEEDYNDFALIFAISGTASSSSPSPSPTSSPTTSTGIFDVLFRLQGITESRTAKESTITIEKSGSVIKKLTGITSTSSSSGIFETKIDSSTFCSSSNTFDVLIKGQSHLAKKFEGVSIKCDGSILDKSTDADDELIAGDVNGDNTISIEDISIVLKYYTDFSVTVDSTKSEMVASDINKDGFITIDDAALVALNWSDFTVSGDE